MTGATKTLSVRIQGLDTPYWYTVMSSTCCEQAGERRGPDYDPKVRYRRGPDVLHTVDGAWLLAIETAQRRSKQHLVSRSSSNSAAGIAISKKLRLSRARRLQHDEPWRGLTCLPLVGIQTTGIGGTQRTCTMLHDGKALVDPWHWAQDALLACLPDHRCAAGRRSIRDFSTTKASPRARQRRSGALGMVGNGHPPQNKSPSQRGLYPSDERRVSPRNSGRDETRQGNRRRWRNRLQRSSGRYRQHQTGRGHRAASPRWIASR